ncbi:MAG: glycosyltransferase, partial [Planctomycetota bacterium]
STIELTALRKPFIFFPIEGHSEQEAVARRVARHKAGVQMSLSETTSSLLAEQIIIYLGKRPNSSPVPTEGAKRAAQLINQIL